jgi:hypothetical protein
MDHIAYLEQVEAAVDRVTRLQPDRENIGYAGLWIGRCRKDRGAQYARPTPT